MSKFIVSSYYLFKTLENLDLESKNNDEEVTVELDKKEKTAIIMGVEIGVEPKDSGIYKVDLIQLKQLQGILKCISDQPVVIDLKDKTGWMTIDKLFL